MRKPLTIGPIPALALVDDPYCDGLSERKFASEALGLPAEGLLLLRCIDPVEAHFLRHAVKHHLESVSISDRDNLAGELRIGECRGGKQKEDEESWGATSNHSSC